MSFLAVGVEHSTAPLQIRERAALDTDQIERTALDLIAAAAIDEAAVLSTCNRTEFYLFAADAEAAVEAARDRLAAGDDDVRLHIRVWRDTDAVEHLFRVASGLESQVLGETQVLSQVREAYETAQRVATVGPNLHALFRTAISCARQARAGTALGRIELSIGSEAVRAATAALGSLQGRAALVIGGGEIARIVAAELARSEVRALFIANRTVPTAVEIASQLGGTPAALSDLPRLLPRIDLVISATTAPRYVLTPEDFAVGSDHPVYIVDLAIPRDVDPAVGVLPLVTLHDLDTLLPAGLDGHWEGDIRQMEAVIAAEVHEFNAWFLTRRVAPLIAGLRSHVEVVSQQELKRIEPHLDGLTARQRSAVESMNARLVDKMFHHLVLRLRLAAQTDPKLVDAAEFFFLHGEGGLFPHAAEEQPASASSPQETGQQS